MNTKKIFNRLSLALDIKTDSDIAKSLGISPQAIANARNRGTIPYDKIVALAEKESLSLDFLLLGKTSSPNIYARNLLLFDIIIRKVGNPIFTPCIFTSNEDFAYMCASIYEKVLPRLEEAVLNKDEIELLIDQEMDFIEALFSRVLEKTDDSEIPNINSIIDRPK